MVCRKVQVARPSCSTSGGQFGGRRSIGSGSDTVAVAALVPASAAIVAAVALEPLLVAVPFGSLIRLQSRKAVQDLQGLPSGPKIIPGGKGFLVEFSGMVTRRIRWRKRKKRLEYSAPPWSAGRPCRTENVGSALQLIFSTAMRSNELTILSLSFVPSCGPLRRLGFREQ